MSIPTTPRRTRASASSSSTSSRQDHTRQEIMAIEDNESVVMIVDEEEEEEEEEEALPSDPTLLSTRIRLSRYAQPQPPSHATRTRPSRTSIPATSSCGGPPSSSCGGSIFNTGVWKGKENVPPSGESESVVAGDDNTSVSGSMADVDAATAATPVTAIAAPARANLRRSRTTSSIPTLHVDPPSSSSAPPAATTTARASRRLVGTRSVSSVESQRGDDGGSEVLVDGNQEDGNERERKRMRRTSGGESSSSTLVTPAIPSTTVETAPTRRRSALGRSISYAGTSSTSSPSSSTPSIVVPPASTPRRRSSAASTASFAASVSGSKATRGVTGRRRELSVSSVAGLGSVRSEFSPAPPSTCSSSSSTPINQRGTSSPYILLPPRSSGRSKATGDMMDVDVPEITRPNISRTSSSELDLEALKISVANGTTTPTKKRGLVTPSKSRNDWNVPAMSSSSSPSVDYEEVFTPQATPTKGTYMSRSSSDSGYSKTNKQVDGYKALKAVLKCSSASTGDLDEGVSGVGADDLVGRKDEKAFLWRYLTNQPVIVSGDGDVDMRATASSDKRAVYISGPPGTGKTAVVSSLANALCSDEERSWKVAFVNCMGLSAGRAKEELWQRIGNAWGFGGGKGSAERIVEQGLTAVTSESESFLLVLDEVDVLLPHRSSSTTSQLQLFKTFLSLPSVFPNNNIKVISISNSLDLTFRGNVASALGEHIPHNLIFRAYEAKDMIDIVRARVMSVQSEDMNTKVFVDDKAIELIGRKVEAQNGDLRQCLSVMVAAVEMSEADYKRKLAEHESGGLLPMAKVSLPHVSKAVVAFNQLRAKANGGRAAPGGSSSGNQSSGSPELNTKVRALSLQVRMVLLSFLVARQRQSLALRPVHVPAASASYSAKSGSDNLSPEALYATYAHLLSHATSPFPPASQPDYMDLIMQLEVLGLFSLDTNGGSPSKQALKQKKSGKGKEKPIELLAKEDDLKVALGIADATRSGAGALEDEARSIWAREDAKCVQAVQNRERVTENAKRQEEQTCARGDLL